MTDPYESLGLEPGADVDEIRSAYRKLARQFHPDRFTDAPPKDQRAAHERMQEINQALAVLTDPAERERFERQQRLRDRRNTASGRQADHARAGAEDATDEAGRVLSWDAESSRTLPVFRVRHASTTTVAMHSAAVDDDLVGVPGEVLDVPRAAPGVERGSDCGVPQGVRRDGLVDSGAFRQPAHNPPGGVTVQPAAICSGQQWSFGALTNRSIDGRTSCAAPGVPAP